MTALIEANLCNVMQENVDRILITSVFKCQLPVLQNLVSIMIMEKNLSQRAGYLLCNICLGFQGK